MNEEDKLVLGTLAGLDLILSPEHYEEYKGTLNKQLEEANQEIERLNNIIKEAINYIDDNTYYKDHKGHINIDDLYIILQKVSDNKWLVINAKRN